MTWLYWILPTKIFLKIPVILNLFSRKKVNQDIQRQINTQKTFEMWPQKESSESSAAVVDHTGTKTSDIFILSLVYRGEKTST